MNILYLFRSADTYMGKFPYPSHELLKRYAIKNARTYPVLLFIWYSFSRSAPRIHIWEDSHALLIGCISGDAVKRFISDHYWTIIQSSSSAPRKHIWGSPIPAWLIYGKLRSKIIAGAYSPVPPLFMQWLWAPISVPDMYYGRAAPITGGGRLPPEPPRGDAHTHRHALLPYRGPCPQTPMARRIRASHGSK